MKTILLIFFSFNLFYITNQESIKLTLFYEPLCPYSISFFLEQLKPTYYALGDFLNITLNPFGNGNLNLVNGQWVFECQHGFKECLLDKIHACALFTKTERKWKNGFVICMMTSGDPTSLAIAKNCAWQNHLDWYTIVTCVRSEEGNDHLAYYSNRNLEVNVPHVPYIILNGVVNEAASDDLFRVVCNMAVNRPPECSKENFYSLDNYLPGLSSRN